MALSLIGEFIAQGHEVDLVLAEAKGELLPLLPPTVRVFDLKARRMRQAVGPLVRYLCQRRPDAVQARMWPLTIIAIAARALARSPARLVVSDHNNLDLANAGLAWRGRAIGWSMRAFYPLADARVCVSAALADQLSRLSGLKRSRFEVIHNPSAPPPAVVEGKTAIEALWTGAERRILTVGSLKAQKNQALLIRAFARIHQPANLMIVGKGPLRRELEELADALGVSGRVAMPGFALDPWPYYATADLFVLSSDYEGFANVLVEALAMGLPVVSTNCESGPREVLDGGRLGRLVPVGDVEAMARAIGETLDGTRDPEPLKARARAFSPGAAADRYLHLLLGR